jgi:hypothetical protein
MTHNTLLRERKRRFVHSDGQLVAGIFSPADVSQIVAIPAYQRQLEGDHIGTLPHLIADCVHASERECADVGILVTDDSPDEFAALNAPSIRCALGNVPDILPPIWFLDRADRLTLWERVEPAIGDGVNPELTALARSMLVDGGYGPQRVRIQALTFGLGVPIMSRDSDLALLPVKPFPGGNTHGHRFQYVRELPAAFDPEPHATYLSPRLAATLGMTIAEAAASGIPVYDELIVTKDAALTACNAGADGVEYGYLPRGIPSIRERSRIITSVFAHKWGTPDINGFRSLLAYISRERGMGAYALPVASHGEGRSSFVVCSTPNPDCGTETTISSSLEVMVPWLVSNPALIGKGKTLLSTGVRAEDQLRTHNNRVAVVYSPEAWFHTRANEGRREENSLETFLSEDFGDLLAALVRMHLGPDGWSAEFSCLEGDDFTRGFYQQVVQPVY